MVHSRGQKSKQYEKVYTEKFHSNLYQHPFRSILLHFYASLLMPLLCFLCKYKDTYIIIISHSLMQKVTFYIHCFVPYFFHCTTYTDLAVFNCTVLICEHPSLLSSSLFLQKTSQGISPAVCYFIYVQLYSQK